MNSRTVTDSVFTSLPCTTNHTKKELAAELTRITGKVPHNMSKPLIQSCLEFWKNKGIELTLEL